jgi:hypothetical protein
MRDIRWPGGWRASEPAVEQRLAQRAHGRALEPDQDRGEAVEVWDCEERLSVGGEHSFLLSKIRHPNREDRPFGNGVFAEAPQIGFAERAFPSECLAGDGPGLVAVPLTLRDLWELVGC